MALFTKSKRWIIEGLKYNPSEMQIELRPDKKRVVLHWGDREIWIDCADVKVVCEAMTEAVTEAKLTMVVEDDEIPF